MHNGCILCGGVGVGKTHTAIQYYLNNEAPKPVYVITTAKKRDKGDWQEIWAQVGMHKDPELTMGAVVIVDSWENIKKYQEVTDAFFIFDEQRLVGTGAWVKAFYTIAQANRWIMLSATPGDNWLDYVPVFRANGFIKNLTQFKDEHVVQKWTGRYYQVRGYRQVGKLVRWRNQLLVDMPYEKHTTRHHHDIEVEYDKEAVRRLERDRWHVLENRPLTDASELFRVMRKVVYTDESRLVAVRKLLETHPKLIVFYNFDYELEMLRTLAGPSSKKQMTKRSQSTSQNSSRISSEQSTPETDWDWLLSEQGLQANRQLSGEASTSTESGEPSKTYNYQKENDACADHQERNDQERILSQDSSGSKSLGSEYTIDKGTELTRLKTSKSKSSSRLTTDLKEQADSEKENDECYQKNHYRPQQPSGSPSTSTPRLPIDTQPTKSDTERTEGSPSSSGSLRSSSLSRQQPGRLPTGRSSTSQPQFQVAEWNGHKHEEVPTTTSWVYLVQYVAGAEAWECTDTDAICFFSMPYSYKIWHQAHGRIDRLNTAYLDLHYYRLISRSKIDLLVKASLKAKKSFNESRFRPVW